MDYMLTSEASSHELEANVKHYLSKGWIPCGGVTTHENRMFQAMIKHDEITASPLEIQSTMTGESRK